MVRFSLSTILAALLVTLLSVIYFSGISGVPFHPDESTQIFMSSDIETIFESPFSFSEINTPLDALRIHYRQIDSPLTRYLIGIARSLVRLPPLNMDWNWSESWEKNSHHGALPSGKLLIISRLAVSFLYPFSLLLVYQIGKVTDSPLAGLSAVLVFGTNSLVLLHTRRAMAESLLVFSVLLFLWWSLKSRHRAWSLSFPAALAVSAKQSSIGLLLVSLVEIFCQMQLQPKHGIFQWKKGFFLFLFSFAAMYFLLNPYLWGSPIRNFSTSLVERRELNNRMVSGFKSIDPESIQDSLGMRSLVWLGNGFFTPLAIEDVSNYHRELAQASAIYLSNPLNTYTRGLYPGTAGLLLFLLGLSLSIRNSSKDTNYFRLVVGFFSLWIPCLFLIQLPFQRYGMVIVPHICIFQAVALSALIKKFPIRCFHLRGLGKEAKSE